SPPKVLLHLCRYSGIPERCTIFPAGQRASSQRKLQWRALNHYERAANLGASGAIQRLGELYRDGQGVPTDLVAAYMWFAIGAKMGAPDSAASKRSS
ncbi:MAG: hypothetical protein WCB11_13890, partial [Terriglobales bacterium]